MPPPQFAVTADLIRKVAHLKAVGHNWDTISLRLHVPVEALEHFPAEAPDWDVH